MLQTALTIDSIDNDTNQEEAQLKKQFLKEAVHYLKNCLIKAIQMLSTCWVMLIVQVL